MESESFQIMAQRLERLTTILKTIQPIIDKADEFPEDTRETLGRIEFFIGSALQQYDFAASNLLRQLNQLLGELKAHLLKLQADGEDISKCASILEQAGRGSNAPDRLPSRLLKNHFGGHQ